jgi:L-asparaginase / beta-aspartyl-peptidase
MIDDHRPTWALAIHGGAGAGRQERGAEDLETEIRQVLSAVLADGAAGLATGGTSLDAVEQAVRRLEDSPLFNAGRGAVYDARGEHVLEASIMDGRRLEAGAVAGLRTVKNPISLARLVMERSPHVFLDGEGALAFGEAHGVERVDAQWFDTPRRRRALEEAKRIEAGGKAPLGAAPPETGTVGAVALDLHGNVAAATSTGGLTNKAPGRIGDSPIIGAGTFASNDSCAVSCSGQGECFVRATIARDVAALMEYVGMSVEAAAKEAIRGRLARVRGEGGLIAVDREGRVAFAFNTAVMLRGCVTSTDAPRVALYADR